MARRLSLSRRIKHQKYGTVTEYRVWVWDPSHSERLAIRLVISLLPRQQARQARARKQARIRLKKGAKANLAPAWWAGVLLLGTTLPQETRQESRAVSFTKGCYLGQEIVERIRARGQVHRVLAKIAIDGEDPPRAGTVVVAGGQEIGKLTSPAYSPRLGRSLGLAIIRREFAAPDTAVTIGGRPGRVID